VDRAPSVSVPTGSAPRGSATASKGGAMANARRSNNRRAAADRARNFRNSSAHREPNSRSNRHKARWASSSRLHAAGAADAVAAVPGTTLLRVHRSSKMLAPLVPTALRIHLVVIVARARTVPAVLAVPAIHDRIGLRVRKVVPSGPRQQNVHRLRKGPALPQMPRRASAAVSVVAVAAVVAVVRAAVRRKASKPGRILECGGRSRRFGRAAA